MSSRHSRTPRPTVSPFSQYNPLAVLVEIVIFVIVVAALFELVEHVVIPLAAAAAGKKRRPATGAEGMVGKVASVIDWAGAEGRVLVDGEIWRAVCSSRPAAGDEVVVRAVRGLTLEVAEVTRQAERG
jgi:membrane-bound ClpP family serine protease